MADGDKRVWSFNEGILHCRNRDMGKYGSKPVWRFIGGGGGGGGGRYNKVLLYIEPLLFEEKSDMQRNN